MRNIIVVLTIMVVAFCSCKKISGNGDVITETINLEEYFNEVRNETKFDIEVYFANENNVVITGESNIIHSLSINVKSKQLVIKKAKAKYTLFNTKPVTIKVYMNNRNQLKFSSYGVGAGNIKIDSPLSEKITYESSGTGDITAFNTENEAVEVKITGSGNVEISGVAGEVIIRNSGSGNAKCYSLSAQFVEIHNSGSGRVEAFATDAIEIWQTGSGEVYTGGTENVIFH